MQIIRLIVIVGIMTLLFPLSDYSDNPRLVAIFNEDSHVLELGSTERVSLKVKNTGDVNATMDIYIASTDAKLRYRIWLENHWYGSGRVQRTITLGPHEEIEMILNVLGGQGR